MYEELNAALGARSRPTMPWTASRPRSRNSSPRSEFAS